MHQLLQPPVPELFAEHPLTDVLERVNIDLDAIALGDYHAAEETVVDGTKVWYAGSTERCARREMAPRSVSLLHIEDGQLSRQTKELTTRPFLDITVSFADGDGRSHAETVIDRHDVAGSVVMVFLKGKPGPVSSRDVRELVMERGAAVCRVKDDRGGPDRELSEGPSGAFQSVGRLIDDLIADEGLSDLAQAIEHRVRSDETATTNLDREIETMIQEAVLEETQNQSVQGNTEPIETSHDDTDRDMTDAEATS
jgi:DNA repair exonuclease SbcCD nuclease subunit